jgi:hypothetical protein
MRRESVCSAIHSFLGITAPVRNLTVGPGHRGLGKSHEAMQGNFMVLIRWRGGGRQHPGFGPIAFGSQKTEIENKLILIFIKFYICGWVANPNPEFQNCHFNIFKRYLFTAKISKFMQVLKTIIYHTVFYLIIWETEPKNPDLYSKISERHPGHNQKS